MALRIILMGLVASMGFDVPSGPEFSSWTQSGRAWVHARMVDLTGSDVEADQPDAEPTGCLQADASITVEPSPSVDKTFVDVSEAMVAGFVADAMTMTNEPSTTEAAPATLAGEPAPVGLPFGEELPGWASTGSDTDPAGTVESKEVAGEETTLTDEAPTRLDRISSAVQLSRDAVQAWTNLMREAADDCLPTR
jgi:hypothetical protein